MTRAWRSHVDRWATALALGDTRELFALTLYAHVSSFFMLTFLAHDDVARFILLVGAALLLVLSVLNEPNRRPTLLLPWLAFVVIQGVVTVVLLRHDGLWTFTVVFWFSTTIPMLLIAGTASAVIAMALSLSLLVGAYGYAERWLDILPRLTFAQAPGWFLGAFVALQVMFLPQLLLVYLARAQLVGKMHRQGELASARHAQVQEQRAREQQYIALLSADLKTQVAHLQSLHAHGTPDAATQDSASEAHLAALAQRVDELHDFAELEAGHLSPRPQPIELAPWLAQLVQQWNQDHAHFPVTMVNDGQSLDGLTLSLDIDRVKQILHKLLQHGMVLNPSDDGSAQLRISALRGDMLRMEVFVANLIISPIELGHIVAAGSMREAYTQLTVSRHTLGLAMANALAHLLDGDIHIRSVLGHGASLTLVLPWIDVEATLDQMSTPSSQARLLGRSTQGPRVLLVDDNPVSRMVLFEQVHRLSSQVTVWMADSAKAAMRVLEESDVDVVLMDVHMSVVNGFQCTMDMRSRWPVSAPPVIGLTPILTQDIERDALRSGMMIVLEKPCEQATLQRAVLNALDRKAL